jgi:hypothetical protein
MRGGEDTERFPVGIAATSALRGRWVTCPPYEHISRPLDVGPSGARPGPNAIRPYKTQPSRPKPKHETELCMP